MKIKATIEISIDVEGKQLEKILANDKTAFLTTIYNGNNKERPELGKWYLEGDYLIADKIRGTVK